MTTLFDATGHEQTVSRAKPTLAPSDGGRPPSDAGRGQEPPGAEVTASITLRST
jgi:hypothetical protein